MFGLYNYFMCIDKPSQLSNVIYQLLFLDCPTLKVNQYTNVNVINTDVKLEWCYNVVTL